MQKILIQFGSDFVKNTTQFVSYPNTAKTNSQRHSVEFRLRIDKLNKNINAGIYVGSSLNWLIFDIIDIPVRNTIFVYNYQFFAKKTFLFGVLIDYAVICKNHAIVVAILQYVFHKNPPNDFITILYGTKCSKSSI